MGDQTAAEQERTFEELKEEHMRALKAGDVEALQRVQEKLGKPKPREREAASEDQELRAANRGLSAWLIVSLAAVAAAFSVGFILS
jgi:hypothetical protein